MNVLLTGGAGFIGSHVLRALAADGHTCVVYDNLCNGHAAGVGDHKLIVADVTDGQKLRAAMRENSIDTVIHFAAFIEAGESVAKPGKYFRNNVLGTLEVLESMCECDVGRMVFSSTAAVYGMPDRIPIEEDDRPRPINPYGASKLCAEMMLGGFVQACGMGFVSLRYFNVAGADPAGDIGEDHDPETHLIPLTLRAAMGKRAKISILGDDYDTPDGTCIRDYIHVCDLADAHVLAAGAVENGNVKVYNLGNGDGFSVREVIETCREVTGHEIPAAVAPRRGGDAARLVASSQRAAAELGWRPKYPDLKTIVSHAWKWHSSHPDGYDTGNR